MDMKKLFRRIGRKRNVKHSLWQKDKNDALKPVSGCKDDDFLLNFP
jgi:hypothetical protein